MNNAARLTDHLQTRLAAYSGDEKLADLTRLERGIITGLEFVVIRVPQVADAFVIFETLNDRGLALSAGDLLKNHLLANAAKRGDSVDELAAEWDKVLTSLGTADVTRFLRHYLLIEHPRVLSEEVFSYFKRKVERMGARALMAELLMIAESYGQFVDPSRVEAVGVRESLEDLATLGAVMCYTALLPARRYVGDEAFASYARLAETLTFRYSTICSKDSKELERQYHTSAKLLSDSEGSRLTEARRVLIDAMPQSDEFKAAFMRQSMGRKYVVNYVLRKLEEHADSQEKRTRGSGPVHVEHIMPQTLNEAWRKVLDGRLEESPTFVSRWGNLTLLDGKKNSTASNEAWEKKREVYRTSQIVLTRRLTELPRWDLDAIVGRQEELAQMADQVWAVVRE